MAILRRAARPRPYHAQGVDQSIQQLLQGKAGAGGGAPQPAFGSTGLGGQNPPSLPTGAFDPTLPPAAELNTPKDPSAGVDWNDPSLQRTVKFPDLPPPTGEAPIATARAGDYGLNGRPMFDGQDPSTLPALRPRDAIDDDPRYQSVQGQTQTFGKGGY
jgi:hypothetical protein